MRLQKNLEGKINENRKKDLGNRPKDKINKKMG
jgi:hypothetical protein